MYIIVIILMHSTSTAKRLCTMCPDPDDYNYASDSEYSPARLKKRCASSDGLGAAGTNRSVKARDRTCIVIAQRYAEPLFPWCKVVKGALRSGTNRPWDVS